MSRMHLFVLPHGLVPDLPPRAEGVVFSDGTIAVRPLGNRAMYLYDDLPAVQQDWGNVCLDSTRLTIMQRFHLVRDVDVSGSSGTGVVAEGVVLSDGRAVMHWLRAPCSTQAYRHVQEVLNIHGHGGSTRVEVLDHPIPGQAAD